MYKVKFDTGQIVDFQNQPTDADIEEVVKKLGIKPKSASIPEEPTAVKEPGYFSRVASKYKEAGQDIIGATKTAFDQTNEMASPLKGARLGLRTSGAVAGSAFAPITEAPIIKNIVELAGKGIAKIPGVKTLAQKAQELSQKYPEASQDIQDIVNVAVLAASAKAPKSGKTVGQSLEKAGQKIQTQAQGVIDVKKRSFLEKLVRPEQTKAIKEAQVGRTTETGSGILKKSYIKPTGAEESSIKAISEIPKVSVKNTNQQNFNIIKDFNVKEAVKLTDDIAKNDFVIPKKEITSALNKAKARLSESPLLTGDASKTADKILAKTNQLVAQNQGTGSGILKARKALDNWIESQSPKVFDANRENAVSLATKEIRKSLNDLLDTKAPNLKVKASLQKQSSLYNALDTLKVKAAKEADTAIGRTLQKIGTVLDTKGKIVGTAGAITGVGIIGSSQIFAPIVAQLGGVYALYRAGKWVLRPEARKAFGQILTKYGSKIPVKEKELLQGLIGGASIKTVNRLSE